MNRLLFIDNDDHTLSLNRAYFTEHGFTVDTVTQPQDALRQLECLHYDCIILESRTEDWDGFDLCRKLRAKTSIPIIFLAKLGDDASVEKGFLSGADDYVRKPFCLRELELRILNRIHNHAATPDSAIHFPDRISASGLHIHPDEKQAYIGTQSLCLTVNEFLILQFLHKNKGIPFKQEEIYEAIWGECYNSHSIQVLITRIRKKIKLMSPEKEYIRTQWGKGYVYTE